MEKLMTNIAMHQTARWAAWPLENPKPLKLPSLPSLKTKQICIACQDLNPVDFRDLDQVLWVLGNFVRHLEFIAIVKLADKLIG